MRNSQEAYGIALFGPGLVVSIGFIVNLFLWPYSLSQHMKLISVSAGVEASAAFSVC